MQCPRCQHENREGRRLCAEYGVSLALVCSACRFSNEAGDKSCAGCGARLFAAAPVASPKVGSPHSYTPKHLADRGPNLGETVGLSDAARDQAREAHYRTAVALASGLRMRPLVAHCHLGLGKLYRRTAREHINTATTTYREMEMRSWLEQAETELKLLA